MRTLRMTLAYDGSRYHGWQVQPGLPSIQRAVQQALLEFTGETIFAFSAGRTDAGVHAVGQVVSFHTNSPVPAKNFRPALQTYLPDDIVIREVRDAPEGFHAQYGAVRKRYRYIIHNAAVASPFLRHYAGWHRLRLDEVAMQAAADVLLGTHDFRCFESDYPNRETSVRTVMEARMTREAGWPIWWNPAAIPLNTATPEELGDFLCFDIVADGFLYNMVRAIVGTLIHVGRGRWSAADMRRILETGDRSLAGETAPAAGLYLMQVDYE